MKHPFQHVLLDKTGDFFFAAAINSVFLFKFTPDGNDAKLLGSWTDEVDPYYTIRKHHRELLEQYEQQQREKAQKEAEDVKINENNKRTLNPQIPEEQIPSSTKQIMNKKPKLPLPGPGAPPTYTYIRDMCLSRNNKYLIVTTDNDKAVVVFEVNYDANENDNDTTALKLIKRQPMSKRPSAVTTSMDDSNIIISDKFGDVYSISMTDPTVVDDSKLVPILGHVSMLTCVQNAIDENGHEVIMTADRDEHIRISYYPKSYVIKKILFAHKEFISSFVLPEWCNGKVLVSAGGDSFICSWLWQNEGEFKELKNKISIDSLIKDKLNSKHLIPEKFQNAENNLVEYCVSKIVPLNKSEQLVVIFERIPSLFLFDLTKDGELTFAKEYPVNHDIITATSSNNKLIVSFDAMDQCLQFFTIEDDKSLVVSQNSDKLLKAIDNANDAVIGDIDELIPLFNTNYMRKRREH